MPVSYHPDAQAELNGASQFYESRVSGLGARFLSEYERAIAEIVRNPLAFALVEDDIRMHLLKRFPFAVYYRVLTDAILILAVKHHSRDSDYWKYRK